MTPTASCERVRSTDTADVWRTLAARTANIFSTFEWGEAWWQHFGAGRERITALCRDRDEAPIALLPLYVERRGPVRFIRFIGDGAGGQVGPVCAPEDREQAGKALLQFLDGFRGWDVFIGRAMPGSNGWSRVLGASVLNQEPSPVVDLRGRDWDDFVSGRSKHFRRRVLNAKERLGRKHGLRYRLVTDPEELPDALSALFDLHRRMRAGRPSSFLRLERFHRDFTQRALENGWLRLWVLELEDRPAGAVLDYVFGGVMAGYQLGMDPRWRRKMHIRLLITNSIRAACNEGLKEYRLGKGGEEYKYQFADVDPGVESLVIGRGPVGRPLASVLYRGRELRPTVRRLQRATERLGRNNSRSRGSVPRSQRR